MDKKQQIDNLVNDAKNIIIIGHKSHDLDAVASMLAMMDYVQQNFEDKSVTLLLEDHRRPTYKHIPGYDLITFEENITESVKKTDLVILVDSNEISRFSNNPDVFKGAKTVLIDHHPINFQGTISLIDESSISACNVIYSTFYKNKNTKVGDKTYLYILAGIFSDSNAFEYIRSKNITELEDAIELLKLAQKDFEEIKLLTSKIYAKELDIFKILINNSKIVDTKFGKLMYTFASEKETPGFSGYYKAAGEVFKKNILKYVEDARWGFTVKEEIDGDFTISFRSVTGYPDVSVLAKKFNGGGHPRASGGEYVPESGDKPSAEEVCQRIVETINSMELPILM